MVILGEREGLAEAVLSGCGGQFGARAGLSGASRKLCCRAICSSVEYLIYCDIEIPLLRQDVYVCVEQWGRLICLDYLERNPKRSRIGTQKHC